MKKQLLLIFLFLITTGHYLHAQTKPITIKGIVKDSLKKDPLSYVTVSLQEKATGHPIKSALTKDNGSFEISTVAGKDYKIVFVFIGYKNKTINITGNELGTILLAPTSNQLNEVSIVAAKPIVRQEVDRISYDIQADPENKVLTVLDMLRKVPMVSVDGTDAIKLKGNSNYKILINGKESALIAKNPSDVFKAMPASNIEKIEVITTPPAKYDAEGLAGIINIITKKNLDQGYNGSVNLRYNSIYGPGANLNLTLKQGKFGFGGYVGYNRQNQQTTTNGSTNDIIAPIVSNLIQQGTQTRNGNNLYGSAELSYEIDTLNLLTGNFQHYSGNNHSNADQLSNQYNGNGSAAQFYELANAQAANYSGYDMGINYQLGFKHNKDQLLTTSYKYSLSSNTQNNDANYLQYINYQYPNSRLYNYKQYNNSGTKEHTIQLDYVQPFKVWTVEAGAKAILRNNYSNIDNASQSATSADYITDPAQSNDLNYKQDIYSVYNSYQLKLKSWVGKAGLRVEHTTVDANFNLAGTPLDQAYTNLVPSVSLQRTLNATNSLTFGFTERVQRPGIWQLNPFVDRSDPKFINVGNPNLMPVTNHTFELNYSNFAKGSINVGVNYAFANNTVESVLSVNPADTVTTTTYQNVGKNRRLGLDINTNYPISKKLNVNINAELIHVWLSGTYNGQFYNHDGNQGHIFTYTSYKFEHDYTMGLNIGYDSRYVLLQGLDNDYLFYSISGSKDILKKKATISLNVNNPFEKIKRLDYFSSSNTFVQSNYNNIYARQINISFNYKFGKLNSEIKKNQRGINNDDVSGGRGH